MYYRVAIQMEPSPLWQWKSTVLSSLDALFQYLRLYHALPQDRLRVFSCSSWEEMNEQLRRENKGVSSTSVTAAQFLQESRNGKIVSYRSYYDAPGFMQQPGLIPLQEQACPAPVALDKDTFTVWLWHTFRAWLRTTSEYLS